MIDTHAHLYAEEFASDRPEMIQRAIDAGIKAIILPNVDQTTIGPMLDLEKQFPGYCFPAIGLHPTSVDAGYKNELQIIESWLSKREFIAIGEIGIDLYWDKSFLEEQIISFETQLNWSLKYDFPVIIHVRDSFDETLQVLEKFDGKGLRGIFHSFTGNIDQAKKILGLGDFKLGINGIVTFKNSGLGDVVRAIDLENIVLETDAPYLTPAPYRGKRNESSMIKLVAEKLAEIYGIENIDVISKTTQNAKKIFGNEHFD
jgi:TatD DNase family protein